ncbi:MAG: YggT family protein [Burkholderiaceae bacterium]
MLQNIFSLVVNTVASVLGGVLLLRFWMQVIRVRPPATIGQFIFQISDWLVRSLRRLLPGVGGIDWASLVGAYLMALTVVAVDLWLAGVFSYGAIVVLALLRLCEWIFYGFMASLIIDAVFSWVNPHAPLAPFVRALNDPLLRPLRRVIPLVGNIDLSPLVALVLLQIGLRIVSTVLVGAL